MQTTAPIPGAEGRTARILHGIEHASHLLPAQAPLRLFVHHNTLHGLQHLPFERALAEAEDLLGARPFYPEARFRAFYAEGRIKDADLDAAIAACPELNGAAPLWQGPGESLTRASVIRAALLHDVQPTTPHALAYALEHGAVQPSALWDAALSAFGLERWAHHPETLAELPVDLAESLLLQLEGEDPPSLPLTERQDQDASAEIACLLAGMGERHTMRRVMQALTGQDLLDLVRVPLTRIVGHQLDEGVAAWHSEERQGGLLHSWRRLFSRGFSLDLTGAVGWRKALRDLPEDPVEVIAVELDRLGLPEDRWEGYLVRLALELPGWAGMVRWREQHPDHRPEAPAKLAEFLAIRLFLDNQHIQRICREAWRVDGTLPALSAYLASHPPEALVRLALYRGELPDPLAEAARALAEDPLGRHNDPAAWRPVADRVWTWQRCPVGPAFSGLSVFSHAWPLFQLSRALSLSPDDLLSRGAEGCLALVDLAASLDPTTRGMLWLEAFEAPYREGLFAALASRAPQPAAERAEAQLIFCIDDREEGIRRHLERCWPCAETLGAAGFFGVAMRWKGLDDPGFAPSCPVNLDPTQRVEEVARPGQERSLARHISGKARKYRLRVFWANLRRTLVVGHLGADLFAPAAALTLAGEVFAPLWWSRLEAAVRRAVAPVVETTVRAIREPGDEADPLGFTPEEQADRIAALLRTIGKARDLSRLVVLVGHGSHSLNNPHLAAYDCGACGGRHGGPNARVFARLANQRTLRPLLEARGVFIPEDTVFVGVEHNTGDERITWFDLADLPASHLADQARAAAQLEAAATASAVERCRRFASAPRAPSGPAALTHVRRRGAMIGQPRPELGHATNAAALIGSRDMSRGLFLDRRCFLISYDSINDIEGKILESLLLAVVPVCGGINLEYYFSAANDERLGCGTKVAHNAEGLFGVLDGTSGDLRTGLPRQMVEIHEAMRLLMVVEADTARVDGLLARQPALAAWFEGGWVQLAVKQPGKAEISRYHPGLGWMPWTGAVEAPPTVETWEEWYAGRDGPLPICRLDEGDSSEVRGG